MPGYSLFLFSFLDADKKVFPNFYILGWYSTGSDAQESDMQIHRAVSFHVVVRNLEYFFAIKLVDTLFYVVDVVGLINGVICLL